MNDKINKARDEIVIALKDLDGLEMVALLESTKYCIIHDAWESAKSTKTLDNTRGQTL